MPAPRPAQAPLKRTLTLALLVGPLVVVSLARAAPLVTGSPAKAGIAMSPAAGNVK